MPGQTEGHDGPDQPTDNLLFTTDDIIPCLVAGIFSALLWCRLIGQIGYIAPAIGAALGILAGYLCRIVC